MQIWPAVHDMTCCLQVGKEHPAVLFCWHYNTSHLKHLFATLGAKLREGAHRKEGAQRLRFMQKGKTHLSWRMLTRSSCPKLTNCHARSPSNLQPVRHRQKKKNHSNPKTKIAVEKYKSYTSTSLRLFASVAYACSQT